MDTEHLEAIAEGDAHARWIVENHTGHGPGRHRQRCTICDAWWPCELVSMAALAVLRYEQRNALLAEKADQETDL